MVKLPALAWITMVLASLGLAGCKCCHSCSKGSCSSGSCTNGVCSKPMSGSTTTTVAQPITTINGQPGAAAAPATYKTVPQGMPAPANSSGWNNTTRPPISQPIHQVSASEDDEVDATQIDSTIKPLPAPPSMSEQLQQQGLTPPARPPIGY